MMDFTIRRATLEDIPFIIEVIIEAEKSGTDKLGLSTLFDLSEEEVKTCLYSMLEEEISGCEFSIDSFFIAENNQEKIGAVGGWIEGNNDDKLPSAILKANLMSFYVPKENLLKIKEKSDIISGIQIERQEGSYQLEYVYLKPEYRGNGIINSLIEEHVRQAESCKNMFVQVFANNIKAIHSYEKVGFIISNTFHSSNSQTKDYLPDDTKLLMIKKLNN